MKDNSFRVYDKRAKEYYDSGFVKKLFLCMDGTVLILSSGGFKNITDDVVVEFAIGKNDKNDIKIHEGDRVKHKTENGYYSDGSYRDISEGIIKYQESGFKYQKQEDIRQKYDFEFGDEIICGSDYKVIGNIHFKRNKCRAQAKLTK